MKRLCPKTLRKAIMTRFKLRNKYNRTIRQLEQDTQENINNITRHKKI